MGTSQRVVQSLGWVAAAGLLALLIFTNCSTTDHNLASECGPNGECPAGFQCNTVNNLCVVGTSTTCTDGNAQFCPNDRTCYPPTGPGECIPPAQIACDGAPENPGPPSFCTVGSCPDGQVCGNLSIKDVSGGFRRGCGCVPRIIR